jgi:hypothetical protein
MLAIDCACVAGGDQMLLMDSVVVADTARPGEPPKEEASLT